MILSVRHRWVAAFLLGSSAAAGAPAVSAADQLLNPRVHKQGDAYTLSAPGLGAFRTTRNPVHNARLVSVPGSPVRLALWDEQQSDRTVAPFYAISLNGHTVARVQNTSYEISLRYGQFDPAKSLPSVPAAFAARSANQEAVYIVQFVTQPLDAFREQIEAAGGIVHQFIAQHAFLVRMSPTAHDRVTALPFVRWVGPYHPAYRLEEGLLAQLAQFKVDRSPVRYSIQVFERGPAQQEAVAEHIRQTGGTVHLTTPEGFRLEATLTGPQLLGVVGRNEVLFVDRRGIDEPDMDIARAIGGANFIESVAGFTGTGVRGEVMDVGVRTTHQDFRSRPLLIHSNGPVDSHGTATTGIVFGDGAVNGLGRGMLPSAQGIVAYYTAFNGGTRYTHTAQLLGAPYFAVFQSNSWGSALTTQYTTISAEMDDILFRNDIVITQSQSNAGSQMSRPQAWAKNIVSIGGISHFNTLSTADDRWTSASIGPAADGRIKPDLAHFYDAIFTTTSTNDTAYTTGFGGTSGATPIVSGHFGIFFEMWHNGLFNNPTGPTVFDSRPHATTAKAILINTARQWDFVGETSNLTRTRQGWGRPDLQSLYNLRNRLFVVDQTDVLQNLEARAYRVSVDGSSPLKVTLVYPDPSGTTSSAQHRINDVSLTLVSPSGVVYYGNQGLRGALWSTPGGPGPDTKNTVENVFVASPEAGVWTASVSADEVNQDGYTATPERDVTYSLVVSNGRARRPGVITDPSTTASVR